MRNGTHQGNHYMFSTWRSFVGCHSDVDMSRQQGTIHRSNSRWQGDPNFYATAWLRGGLHGRAERSEMCQRTVVCPHVEAYQSSSRRRGLLDDSTRSSACALESDSVLCRIPAALLSSAIPTNILRQNAERWGTITSATVRRRKGCRWQLICEFDASECCRSRWTVKTKTPPRVAGGGSSRELCEQNSRLLSRRKRVRSCV